VIVIAYGAVTALPWLLVCIYSNMHSAEAQRLCPEESGVTEYCADQQYVCMLLDVKKQYNTSVIYLADQAPGQAQPSSLQEVNSCPASSAQSCKKAPRYSFVTLCVHTLLPFTPAPDRPE